jgi:hypothetical protein
MACAAAQQGLLAKVKDAVAVERHGSVIGFLIYRRDGVDAVKLSGEHVGRWNTATAAANALIELANVGASRCIDA